MFLWIIGKESETGLFLCSRILLTVIGAQFVSLGLIGELITNSRNNDDYIIKYDSYEMENGN